jgi:hypothetical protein
MTIPPIKVTLVLTDYELGAIKCCSEKRKFTVDKVIQIIVRERIEEEAHAAKMKAIHEALG